MPDMDGPTTVRHIRKMLADAAQTQPYIACVTAYTDQQAQKVAIESGMEAFYSKPLMRESIEEIVALLAMPLLEHGA